MRNKGGRHRKLTYEIKDAIIEGVEKGFTLKAACKYAEVSYASLANWKRSAKIKDADIVLYQDLITNIQAATRLLWCQYGQQGLSVPKPEDLKLKASKKRTYQSKKEIETQSVLNLFDRLVILEKIQTLMRHGDN